MWPIYMNRVLKSDRFLTRQDGQDMVEYALVIAMFGVFLTAAAQPLAQILTTELSNIAAAFTRAV